MSPEVKSNALSRITTREKILRPLAASIVGASAIIGVIKDNDEYTYKSIPELASAHELTVDNSYKLLEQQLVHQSSEGHNVFIEDPHAPKYVIPVFGIGKDYDPVEELRLQKEAEEKALLLMKDDEKEKAQVKVQNANSGTVKAAQIEWSVSLQPCGGDLPPCRIAELESHGDYSAINLTGCSGRTCGGKWQFDPRTWNNYGGYAFAQDAPPEIQDAKARETWAGGAGCSHWNAC